MPCPIPELFIDRDDELGLLFWHDDAVEMQEEQKKKNDQMKAKK